MQHQLEESVDRKVMRTVSPERPGELHLKGLPQLADRPPADTASYDPYELVATTGRPRELAPDESAAITHLRAALGNDGTPEGVMMNFFFGRAVDAAVAAKLRMRVMLADVIPAIDALARVPEQAQIRLEHINAARRFLNLEEYVEESQAELEGSGNPEHNPWLAARMHENVQIVEASRAGNKKPLEAMQNVDKHRAALIEEIAGYDAKSEDAQDAWNSLDEYMLQLQAQDPGLANGEQELNVTRDRLVPTSTDRDRSQLEATLARHCLDTARHLREMMTALAGGGYEPRMIVDELHQLRGAARATEDLLGKIERSPV